MNYCGLRMEFTRLGGDCGLSYKRWGLAISMVLAVAGCMPDGFLVVPVSTKRGLIEEPLAGGGGVTGAKIAVLDVEGVILNAPTPQLLGSGEHSVVRLLEQLDKARADKAVRGVLLRINSPGGGVTASELMYREIVHFRESTGKPVVAVMMDVAASGGYYIACACDRITAQRTSVTGSIGVLVQLFDLSGTMQKIGLAAPAITSGPNKDAGSPFRTLDPDERAIFQGIVDDMYGQFIDVVARGRPKLTRERVMELADGRVYTAQQALEAGLIDEITDLRGAIAGLKEQLGVERARLVTYRRPLGYRPNYYAQAEAAPAIGTQMNLINLGAAPLAIPPAPQFMYLWAPGR